MDPVKIKEDPFKYTHTDNVICPYCDHEHEDSYEFGCFGDECGEIECEECDKPIYWVRHITVKYTSKKDESRRN
jgi:hypothetical protein